MHLSYISRASMSGSVESEALHTLKLLNEINSQNAQGIVELVRGALSPKPRTVLLDLSEVPLMDSSGLCALLESKKLCQEAGVEFEIVSVSEGLARLIRISGLESSLGLPEISPSATHPAAKRQSDTESQQWQVHEYVATSDPSVVSDLREKITTAARAAGARGDALCDIQIAVGEALTNACRHGSPRQRENKIYVKCLTCPSAVVVEINDEGERFDFCNCAPPDPAQIRDHGMGIYLMRQAMDVVEFCCDCPGTRVRMIKWL